MALPGRAHPRPSDALEMKQAQPIILIIPTVYLRPSRAKTGAGDAIRTRDIFLGKEVLYH